MKANDIRCQWFGAQLLLGFNSKQVLAFLDDVAEAYDDLQKTNTTLTTRLKVLEAEILARDARETQVVPPPEVLHDAEAQAESMSKTAKEKETTATTHIEMLRAVALQEVEALLHDARAQAQALIDGAREREAAALADVEAARARQRREAEDLVAEATSRAESLIVAAREQETAIHNEIERLSQRRLQVVDDVQATLDTYTQWLETVDPRGRAQGRRKALGTSNGGGDGVGFSDEARAG
jgi:cell division septum initiation protein DivIVA